MRFISTVGPFVGRVLVSAIFLWSGFHKLEAPGPIASAIASRGLPLATAAAVAAGVLELAGGAALVLGYKARAAALLLFLYVAAATYLFHWPSQMVEVMKNLAILGALLGIAAHGPGPLSAERG